MSEPGPETFLPLAERLADVSADIVRRYFRADASTLKVEAKADESPVTIADRSAEAAMRALIEEAYPDHGILGEEFPFVRTGAEYAWVLDPIDGTKAFVTGMPVFGTLIALMRDGRPILGIINQPVTRERWIGVAGRRTTLNGRPIATSKTARLVDAAHYATHPSMFAQGDDWTKVQSLIAKVKSSRYGGDCYAYGLLAAGFIDLVTEARLQIYDFMALIPIIEGAGGMITDWNGGPLKRDSDGHVLAAANAACHAAALELLRDA
jgi:inositol-phosphate phosphatase/L-galactose 1-phosphate phosphatase/histidinol-phosphatase